MIKQVNIGLFGYGVVGKGLYEIIHSNPNLPVHVKKICAKHPEKRRDIPMSNFTFDRYDILNDPEIDLIAEAIDDDQASFDICAYALKNGKNVVTSNKKMLAQHMSELMVLQKENRTALLYEASSCASIPIIRTLEEYYDNDLLKSVSGIFNGSTNYILTKILKENKDYDITLKQAQDLGFSESDPGLDVIGYDALYKLLIVTAHAYGVFIDPKDVVLHGIQYISGYDIQFANERGATIKQIATARKFDDNKIAVYVLPQFVYKEDDLYDVDYEYNAVNVEAAFSQKQFFKGKGAGGHPTGFAMYADISANFHQYKYEYKKHLQQLNYTYSTDATIEVYLRYFDEKNLKHFKFEKISARFTADEYKYVIGEIKLESLKNILDVLNTADIFMVSTGRLG